MRRKTNRIHFCAYLIFLVTACCSAVAFAEEEGETYKDYPAWDWNLFDGDGWTPRYTYLYKDNVLGIAHYAGMSYYHKQGEEMSGATFRYAHGKKGHKYNIAYTNNNWWWGVDFGFSWHVLDGNNRTIPSPNGIAQLGLELGIRYRMLNIIATHTEDYSWATVGISFEGLPFYK